MSETTTLSAGLPGLLHSSGRAPEIAEADDLYGWLVGSWHLDCRHYRGVPVQIEGEAHFGWVLEGRAIQDVWILPPAARRDIPGDPLNNMYGTTLRVWDLNLRAWRIHWRNPARHHHEDQIGRRAGADIVQLGVRPDGTTTRWRFTEITPDSFHWLGEALRSDGVTWLLEGEFLATRIA